MIACGARTASAVTRSVDDELLRGSKDRVVRNASKTGGIAAARVARKSLAVVAATYRVFAWGRLGSAQRAPEVLFHTPQRLEGLAVSSKCLVALGPRASS